MYLDARGRSIRDHAVLQRLHALAIPPAYRDVWICPDPDGHLQATARDARGRKQYRYHAQWQRQRARRKFVRIARLGRCLPAIRRRIARDLRQRGPGRERTLAAIVTLLDLTGQRIGGREYLRSNGSYGLSTLRDEHLRETRGGARLRFRGKSGVQMEIDIDHPTLLRTLRACRDLPGDTLFQYREADGAVRAIDAAEVNDYLRRISGQACTAKDFRTWKASVDLLARLQAMGDEAATRRRLREAICGVAASLGNTPAVCRKAYIDPAVIEAWEEQRLTRIKPADARGLRRAERLYLALAETPIG